MVECECAYCKNDQPFPMPMELIRRIADGNVVVFAGAGISTENPTLSAGTFYDEVRHTIGEAGNPPFPSLMSQFCERPDGRIELISKIKDRFEYFRAFQDFYGPMTRFHRAIRPLYMITDVITTNWDDFFEREAGFEAFVYDADLPFIERASRRVIKMHGSITNVGSIVATSDDYEHSFDRLNNGPLGAYIKTLISTKTIIYTGYSLRDDNYIRLLSNVTNLLGPMARQSYFLSPHIDREHLSALPTKLSLIETDGAFFFEQIRTHINSNFDEEYRIIDDDVFSEAALLLAHTKEFHTKTADKFISSRSSLLPFALSYQDGLIHGLERFRTFRNTGTYYSRHRLSHMVQAYEAKVRDYRRKGDYWNAAYFRGYENALLFLLVANVEEGNISWPPPIELVFAEGVDTLAKVLRFPKSKTPKKALAQGARIVAQLGDSDLVPDHTPYG